MKRFVLMALVSSFLLVGLAAQGMKQDDSAMKSDNSMMSSDDSMMKADDSAMAPEGSMMKADSAMDSSAFDLSMLGQQVRAFSTEKEAWALAKSQTVVYFFAATWCPSCQGTYKDIKANFAKLPKNLSVIFVNYDKSAALKQKYGVTYQHTFVVIGPMGEKKKVWSGSPTVAALVKTAQSK